MNRNISLEKILIIGGVHGVEPQSSFVAEELIKSFKLQEERPCKLEMVFKYYIGLVNSTYIAIIPDFNRYGLEKNLRGNVHGVDLNRNFSAANWSSHYDHKAYLPGSSPASETETKRLIEIIDGLNPSLIIALHTNHYVQHFHPPQVNYDGVTDCKGYERAEKMSQLLELPLTNDIGYPTPGSLGSYAKEKTVPCITLEMDDKYSNNGAWAKYGPELIKFISHLE